MIHVFAQDEVPRELAVQIAQLEQDAWPSEDSDVQALHDPALTPTIMALVFDDEVLASLALLHKQIRHAGRDFGAVGLSAVTTRADVRGRGYGHELVVAAHQHIAASSADLGIFTCDRPQQRFYERAGWQLLPGTVLIGGTSDAPFRSDRPDFDKVTIANFFSPLAGAHKVAFVGADVEIYPGEIDRLW